MGSEGEVGASRGVRGVYLGTSGFSYPEWKGNFYPPKIAAGDMLRHYATRLPSVEINNTFYRMPRRSVLSGWAEQTPENFRFAVKATRRITHLKKLRDAEELRHYLFVGLAELGQRCGPVLFQLPPTLMADRVLLSEFLATGAEVFEKQGMEAQFALRQAFEFRHPTWFTDQIYQVLSDHGAALVSGDLDDAEKDPPLIRSADFAYLRLRKTHYEKGELVFWADRLRELGVRDVFAYFKHEELGPALAEDLRQLLEDRMPDPSLATR